MITNRYNHDDPKRHHGDHRRYEDSALRLHVAALRAINEGAEELERLPHIFMQSSISAYLFGKTEQERKGRDGIA